MGSCTITDLMFASPPGIVSVVSRLAPLALDGLPLVVAVNVGLKPSALQPSAWNGVLTASATAPNVDVSVDSVVRQHAAVGRVEQEALLVDRRRDQRAQPQRDALATIVGSVACDRHPAVVGSTLIVARVTTLPRLNGPATAGTTIDSPYGAPL